jgi:hypothetical protein
LLIVPTGEGKEEEEEETPRGNTHFLSLSLSLSLSLRFGSLVSLFSNLSIQVSVYRPYVQLGFSVQVWEFVRKVVESERKWKLLLKLELSILFFGSLKMATKFKSESKHGNCC